MSYPDRDADVVIRNGRVVDPVRGFDQIADVRIRDGRVVEIVPSRTHASPQLSTASDSDAPELDATDHLVVPGFVDLHAHVYTGVCPLTVPADIACAQSGVTTVVSAGDAGANTIDGFRQLIVDRSLTRVRAFLHISRIGLAGWPVAEAAELSHLDVGAACRAVARHRDIIVGVKVRMSKSITGSNGLLPLERALEVGEALGVPVMLHIGDTESGVAHLFTMLRPGDIVTHCFTASTGGTPEIDRTIDAAVEARRRGVLFDVGHGFGSFDFPTAERFAGRSFFPDTISTDIHSLSAGVMLVDLPATMTKMLAVGMPWIDALAGVTSRAAAAIGRSSECGQLAVGRIADIAIIRFEAGRFKMVDSFGNEREAVNRVVVQNTIRAGLPWRNRFLHPGVSYGSPPAVG